MSGNREEPREGWGAAGEYGRRARRSDGDWRSRRPQRSYARDESGDRQRHRGEHRRHARDRQHRKRSRSPSARHQPMYKRPHDDPLRLRAPSPHRPRMHSPHRPRMHSPHRARPLSPRRSRPLSPRRARPLSPHRARPMSPRHSRPLSPHRSRPLSPHRSRPLSPHRSRYPPPPPPGSPPPPPPQPMHRPPPPPPPSKQLPSKPLPSKPLPSKPLPSKQPESNQPGSKLDHKLPELKQLPSPSPRTPATPKHSPADGIQLYTRISMVGEGTYGKVYKARNKDSGQIVALKRMRIDTEREGFPITAMREIRLLRQLQHPNITRVLDVVPESGSAVYVVMEYMDYDLSGLISHPQWAPAPAQLKSLMQQLLRGLQFMHDHGILHRDIKGSNLLVNQHGQVKYVDFGLARSFHHTRRLELTNRVITLWYRPPELLLGATLYGPEVDVWSLGCVVLELFLRRHVFQGANDIDQLEQIFRTLGAPPPDLWAHFSTLPWACYMAPPARHECRLRALLAPKMPASAADLITWMITMDPRARPTAAQCLAHRFFAEAPPPEPPTAFPVAGDWHEYESKAERRKRKLAAKQDTQPASARSNNGAPN